MDIAQPKDGVEYILSVLTHSLILVWMCSFGILDHNILPSLTALHFDLAEHNRRKVVFGLMSNVSVNLRSDLLKLVYFTGTYFPGGILILSRTHTSGPYTSA